MNKPPAPILVTGFELFGGEAVNPSAPVAQALHGRTIDGVPVLGAVLPCVFGAAIDALRARRSACSAFMHLPLLPKQAARGGPGAPSLPLAQMVDDTALALATASRMRAGDLQASEGALD